jgi:hypothetical protein
MFSGPSKPETTQESSALSLAIIILLILSALGTQSISRSSASGLSTQDNTSSVLDNTTAILSLTHAVDNNIRNSTINTSQALSIAENSLAFKQYSSNSGFIYNSIFETWNFSNSGETTLDTVNVVFSFTSADGSNHNLVITEDSTLNRILTTTIQNIPYFSSLSSNWSGYVMSGNYPFSSPSNPVYESEVIFNVPNVYQPPNGQPQCSGFRISCTLGIWTGLTAPNSNGIAQDGIAGEIDCGLIGCFTSYFGWYEFYPYNPVQCGNSFAPGDQVDAQVYDHAENGGSPTLYDMYVFNLSKHTTCSRLDYNFPNIVTPFYANYIVERTGSGSSPTLLRFDTTTITGFLYYPPAYTGIYTPYSKGWYNLVNMVNGNLNILVGSVTGQSTFTETWLTSQGT